MRSDLKPILDALRYFFMPTKPHPRGTAEAWFLNGCNREEALHATIGVLREALKIIDDMLLLFRFFLDKKFIIELGVIREDTQKIFDEKTLALVSHLRPGAVCRVAASELLRLEVSLWLALETTWFPVVRFDLSTRTVVITPGTQWHKGKSKEITIKTEYAVSFEEVLAAKPAESKEK